MELRLDRTKHNFMGAWYTCTVHELSTGSTMVGEGCINTIAGQEMATAVSIEGHGITRTSAVNGM